MQTASTSGARTTSRQSASTRRMPNSLATRSPDSRERLATATNSTPGCFCKPGMCRLRVLRPAPTKPMRIGRSLTGCPPCAYGATWYHPPRIPKEERHEPAPSPHPRARRRRPHARRRRGPPGASGRGAGTDHHLAHRRVGRPLVDARDHRELPEGESQQGEGGQLPARAGPRAARQDQGAAGRGTRGRQSLAGGPGRRLLCGLPFAPGDKKRMDPAAGWDKTWAFLKEIGESIEYYPTGTAITLKEFAEGTRWIIAGIMEWDMKPRAEGTIPPESKIFILPNTSFVIDGHFWAIPRGVPAAEQEIILDLMKFMRRPDQQVLTWKAFIGPSIKAATLDKAPPDIQKLVQEHWRPEYTDMEKKYKIVPQLPVKELIAAMDRWDKEVGAQRIKKF